MHTSGPHLQLVPSSRVGRAGTFTHTGQSEAQPGAKTKVTKPRMGSKRDRDRALVVGKVASLTKMEDSIKKLNHFLNIFSPFHVLISHCFSLMPFPHSLTSQRLCLGGQTLTPASPQLSFCRYQRRLRKAQQRGDRGGPISLGVQSRGLPVVANPV